MRGNMAKLLERYLPTGPWQTETLTIAHDPTVQPSFLCLVVPGNPGSSRFYTYFMSVLHEALSGRAEVMAISHLGHDRDSCHPSQVWCLDSQIAHKRDFIAQHVLSRGIPTIIMAHSIGSYMTLQALEQLRGAGCAGLDNLVKVVPCFPFFSTDWSSTRQRLLHVASHLSVPLSHLGSLLGSLPMTWQHTLLSLGDDVGLEPHSLEAAAGLLRRHCVRNAFHLAWHEFRDLDQPFPWQLLRQWGPRAAVVAAPNDMWFPQTHLQEMQRELPGLEVVWREDMSHAFCVSQQQCRDMAALVVALIQREQLLPTAAPAAAGAPQGAADAADGREADATLVLADDPATAAAGTKQQQQHGKAGRAFVVERDTDMLGQDRAVVGLA